MSCRVVSHGATDPGSTGVPRAVWCSASSARRSGAGRRVPDPVVSSCTVLVERDREQRKRF